MVSSHDDERIGITFGTKLILSRFYIFAIIILKKNQWNKFEMERFIEFTKVDYLQDICIQFHFSIEDPTKLIFFSNDQIFQADFMNPYDGKEVIYQMNDALESDPQFGVFSLDQKYCLIATADDCIYIDLIKRTQLALYIFSFFPFMS